MSIATPAPAPTTRPVPADRDAPIAPERSGLADLLLDVGIEREVVRGYLTSPYRLKASDIGLMEVSL